MELISTTDTFTVSLENQRSVILSFPWFVSQAKYPPRPANRIEPLINGDRAFRAVYNAIDKAQHSVEIISWGFDPSMRMTRPNGERLGDLLRRRAYGWDGRPPIEIRILIWKNVLANFAENNIPGDGLAGSGGTAVGSGMGSTAPSSEGGTSKDGYNEYGHNVLNSAGVKNDDPEAAAYNRDWYKNRPDRLTFRTRDFSLWDRTNIVLHQAVQSGTAGPSQTIGMSLFASHHQKTVLVDYEHPEIATGFVMGHNLLRDYWDTDAHEFYSPERLNFQPWQDLSCQVWGPVLHDLNENFVEAWRKSESWFSSSKAWREARRALKSEDFITPELEENGEMAQILRTQSQEDDRSILDAYRLAIGNARFYMYFENQYFRYKAFAELLRQVRRKLKGRGWPSDFYIFVVTNIPEGTGRTNTYEMLDALGHGSRMPKYHRDTEKKPDPDAELRKIDLDGVNIHVCTLQVRGDVVGKSMCEVKYNPIYVHSKLMLVDDVFFTLGSANINARSMEGDSELNISCPSPELTKQWREKLWEIHTGSSPEIELRDEYRRWGDDMESNDIFAKKGKALSSSLLSFHDPNNKSWGAPD
ncbi:MULTISPECIES: phospholipase D-like domain-containing protein [Pseudomonas]|uniref:phospholipase D-like domain-containing protein n=1 Tax=Pseudomonas TaxID=286 RepID=UPI00236145D6|nr:MULTISPECIES: phospholipase D-like domain-containing protein [Pseudomonas]WJV25557.1 phospholipase D-like domain-containing protein [Pseudomonas chlororaphis]